MAGFRVEWELSAEEEDSGAIVLEVAEASSGVFEGLDAAVETFGGDVDLANDVGGVLECESWNDSPTFTDKLHDECFLNSKHTAVRQNARLSGVAAATSDECSGGDDATPCQRSDIQTVNDCLNCGMIGSALH